MMEQELDTLRRRYSGHTPGLMGAKHAYAVLCPLVRQEDELHLLFEVRAANLKQGGEVCFPGGRMETGESPSECALRETEEELSIPRSEVTLLGTPDFICSPRGFLLYPIVGLISSKGMKALRPSPAEVAETFTAPLSFFRETPPELYTYDLLPQIPETFPYEAVGVSRNYPWSSGQVEIPIWHWQNHAIWGLTARMVRELV